MSPVLEAAIRELQQAEAYILQTEAEVRNKALSTLEAYFEALQENRRAWRDVNNAREAVLELAKKETFS